MRKPDIHTIHGTPEDPHNLNRSAPAVRLALILHAAAVDLWEISTLDDTAEMWEQARAVASRVLAACERPTARKEGR